MSSCCHHHNVCKGCDCHQNRKDPQDPLHARVPPNIEGVYSLSNVRKVVSASAAVVESYGECEQTIKATLTLSPLKGASNTCNAGYKVLIKGPAGKIQSIAAWVYNSVTGWQLIVSSFEITPDEDDEGEIEFENLVGSGNITLSYKKNNKGKLALKSLHFDYALKFRVFLEEEEFDIFDQSVVITGTAKPGAQPEPDTDSSSSESSDSSSEWSSSSDSEFDLSHDEEGGGEERAAAVKTKADKRRSDREKQRKEKTVKKALLNKLKSSTASLMRTFS